MATSASGQSTAAARTGRSWLAKFAASPVGLKNASLLYVWAAVILVFALWVPDTFLTVTTLKALLSEQAITAIVALAAVVALCSSVFDLSIGAVVGAAAIFVSYLMVNAGLPPVPAALLTLAGGVFVGVCTGTLIVVFKINSFIATLGVSSVLAAFVEAVSNDSQIIGFPQSFQDWATFKFLGVFGVFWIMLVLAAGIWFVLECRPVGRHMRATGSNADAARLAGVRTNRVIFGTAVLTAVIASIAGILVTALVGTGSPTIGPPYLLPGFAAAFLGSTQIRPGRFNVIGTLIAVYALATSVEGLSLAGAPFWISDLFNGVALLVAVALSVMRRGRLANAPGQSVGGKPEAEDAAGDRTLTPPPGQPTNALTAQSRSEAD